MQDKEKSFAGTVLSSQYNNELASAIASIYRIDQALCACNIYGWADNKHFADELDNNSADSFKIPTSVFLNFAWCCCNFCRWVATWQLLNLVFRRSCMAMSFAGCCRNAIMIFGCLSPRVGIHPDACYKHAMKEIMEEMTKRHPQLRENNAQTRRSRKLRLAQMLFP